MLAIGFEIAIEPPDQRARSALSLALFIREGVELVNEALGMDPAQAMRADVELPGVIADDDGVGQEAMRLDAAPQGALGGDHDRIGVDLESRDAEAVEIAVQATWLVKKRCGCSAKRAITGEDSAR